MSPRSTGMAFRWVCCVLALALGLSGCVTENRRELTDSSLEAPPPEPRPDRPPSVGTLHALAKILATQGKDAECERVLTQIIQREPAYVPAYCDLAELHLRANRTDQAMAALTAGLAQSPNDPVLLNNMGMCFVLKEDYAAALDVFNQASGAAPRNPTFLANKAMALGMLERFDEAAAIYRQILASPEQVRRNMAVLRKAQARAHADASPQPPAPPATGATSVETP